MQCVIAVFLVFAIWPALLLNAQVPQHLRLELLRTQLLGRDFQRRQNEFLAWKLEERRRVPGYNAQLNGAVIDFHNHILKDDHYLFTNCGICRKYIGEIKSCTNKLEQAMK
jgi:hypothetical protein